MTETAMTVDTATGPYRLQVASERSLRLVDVENPQGRTYWTAIDEHGRVILCTCPGHAARRFCKHHDLIQKALQDPGIPLRIAKIRLLYNPRTDAYATVAECEETEADVFVRLNGTAGQI